MPLKLKKIRLIYLVIFVLFCVGLVPLLLTGWLLSERSGKELRAVEGRYQTQLVQDKARQIEMFGQRYTELVSGVAKAFEISQDFSLLSSPKTQQRLKQIMDQNPNLLALNIKPVQGEPLLLYNPVVDGAEVERFTEQDLASLSESKVMVGRPQKIGSDGRNAFSITIPVVVDGNITAAVIAVVYLDEMAQIMGDSKSASERELWESGLPMIFVVNDRGQIVYHPDSTLVETGKSVLDLKIVQEWRESNTQISALMPFTAEYDGRKYEMLGAYSTAKFDRQVKLGVIVIQDESKALASVGDMRRQTWLISIAFAFLALLLGFVFARQMTIPVRKLASAAKTIAGGDLSARVEEYKIREINALGASFNTMSDNLAEYIEKLAKAATENRELFVGTVKALAAAIDGKDHYTRGHSERVSRISMAIGQRMGMSVEDLEKLRISSLLHDVGKIAIDDSILKKPSALSDEEYEIMKTHPQKGYKIMSQIPAMKDFLPGMYMHHEMVNGAGYPQGLKGDEIPLQAKIVSVADTYDAMTIDRPYQKGMGVEEAVSRIQSFVGTRYDGKVVEALVQACAEGQIGAGTVKLNPKRQEQPSEASEGTETKVA